MPVSQKGFAPIILLLGLVALIAIVAGGYYLLSNQDTNQILSSFRFL